ncbi:MAG TPA: MMPL family transporter [Terriglobia bacterium]|nr:MMPL family transporter [Terriglobia bacterium]
MTLRELASKEAAQSTALNSAIAATVRFCCNRAWLVVIAAILASAAAFVYLAGHIAIDTDSAKLISDQVPWRQRDAAFDAAFPQNRDQIVIVVDAATAELAETATAALTARLSSEQNLFKTVRRPDGGPFFAQNGLLFLSKDEVAATMAQVIAGQPLLGSLAADPSLRGLMDSLSLALLGVEQGEAKLDDLATPLTALANTVQSALKGETQPLSWRQLITGKPSSTRELRRFILVQPVLDYTALSPGAAASTAIRQAAADLQLTPENNVRVRLTGPVPLEDEEFATLADGAALTSLLTIAAVILLLWLGLRSVKMIAAIVATLFVGLVFTAAFGIAVIGPLNLISVAFAVLFIGLGVDFCIQYCIRYREERSRQADLRSALSAAATGVGRQLSLAAAAIAIGFYAFLPTDYLGVSELGLIAGTGMIIAVVLSLTLLPALLMLLRPAAEGTEVGYAFLAPVDRFLIRRRSTVLAVFAVLAAGAALLVSQLTFDFNPINLKSPKVESVATLLDLMRDPDTTPNTIDILAPSAAAADDLATRLSALPEVQQAVTLSSFVPEQQADKLAAIEDAAMLFGPTLAPSEVKPAPDDQQMVAAMAKMAQALHQEAAKATTPTKDIAARLADGLDRLVAGDADARKRLVTALVPGLQEMLQQLRDSMQAQPVSLGTLPAALRSDWVTADGRVRVQVFPKGDSNDNSVLERFTAAVRAVAPEATGTPISIQESGATIVHAFIEAALWASLAITLMLVLVLRRIADVLLTLAPLALGSLLTLATCVLIGQPINFANIIALPLLFGIGVAFNIYFVAAWRGGCAGLLQTSLARAILFSALTTSTAFGSLWLSKHPGTASMGELLAISLFWTLVTTLIFLPALLGRPRAQAGIAPSGGARAEAAYSEI